MGLKAVANPAAGGQPGSFTTLTVTGDTTLGDGNADRTTVNGFFLLSNSAQGNALASIRNNGNSTEYGLLFDNVGVTNAGARNWGIVQNGTDFGDMELRVSNAKDGDPFSTAASTKVLRLTGAGVISGGYIAGAEQAAPSAPAADGYRIFAQDNGAGKTQLMVIFATGAAQQIAIEP